MSSLEGISPFFIAPDNVWDKWLKLAIAEKGFYTAYIPAQITSGFGDKGDQVETCGDCGSSINSPNLVKFTHQERELLYRGLSTIMCNVETSNPVLRAADVERCPTLGKINQLTDEQIGYLKVIDRLKEKILNIRCSE